MKAEEITKYESRKLTLQTKIASVASLESANQQGHDVIAGSAEGVNRHPRSMPGVANQKVKLLFEKRTRVLISTQMMGDNAVGELINVASACIQHKMTIDDIACFQMGPHPALTASPVVYQFVNAAEAALLGRP